MKGRGGLLRKNLLKWEFYNVIAEELMSYVDNRSVQESTENRTRIPIALEKSYKSKNPTCVVLNRGVCEAKGFTVEGQEY